METYKKLEKALRSIDERIVLYQGDDLCRDGIIDSMMIMDISSELEEEFNIEFDLEDISPKRFATVKSIEGLVLQYLL